jgi:predicted phosphodiesterase
MVLSLGDMIEGCEGWYPQQPHRVEMNLRDQIHTARRLIVRGLKEFSDLAPAVEVVAVGGNHGENREDGKSRTDFADNFDVGIYEAVSDQLGENPERFNNIVFRIPHEELSQTVKERGHVIGLFHGHQVGKGRFTFTKFDNWIKSQAMSRRPIGDADILINGHYHFHFMRYIGQRIHIQAPTLDGGSGWYDEMSGGQEKPGTLVFTLDEDGIDMMKVLSAERGERPDKWAGV